MTHDFRIPPTHHGIAATAVLLGMALMFGAAAGAAAMILRAALT